MADPARIPNRFHFVFGLKKQTEPFHLAYYLCLASCIKVNRPEAVYFYYHYEPYGRYWDLIKEQLILVPVQPVDFIRQYNYTDRYVRRFRYAHESDFIRLEKVLSHGGVYADIDSIFVNPIPRTLHEKSFVLGREDDIVDQATGQVRPSVCNAFILAERNAPFGRLWLDQLQGAFNGTWSNHSTLLPYALAQQHPDLIHLEPKRTFYKHMWTRNGLHTLLQGCDPDFAGVVSMHLWNHLWWSRRRRDFSNFHAGRLTEAHIRQVDTTYNLAARKFLPSSETRRQWWGRQKVKGLAAVTEGQVTVREIGLKTHILARLAAYSALPDRVFPRVARQLDYAKRQWAHSYLRQRIQPRQRFEKLDIVDAVTLWDDYKISSEKLLPSDVVIDVGAHVGSFTLLCHRLGARRIYAYEPERDNFRLLAKHAQGLAGINPHHLAVFRSDTAADHTLTHSGYVGENTGAGTVLMRGRGWDVDRQVLLDERPLLTQTVQVVPLDEILEKFERVKLLKLDCEGSEFPILLTSRLLARVERIIGEFHEFTPPMYAALDPLAQTEGWAEYRRHHLVSHLEQCGFQVTISQTVPHIGQFDAVRQIVDRGYSAATNAVLSAY